MDPVDVPMECAIGLPQGSVLESIIDKSQGNFASMQNTGEKSNRLQEYNTSQNMLLPVQGPLLLTWINFNLSMDKLSYTK